MAKAKILIIDDLPEYLNSLRRALENDFEIVVATSFDEAKGKMSKELSLLLVDICLDESRPGIDRGGIEVLRWSKKNYPAIPVVMMSAYRDFDAAVDCLNSGAEKFLRKPIDVWQLKEELKSLTKQS